MRLVASIIALTASSLYGQNNLGETVFQQGVTLGGVRITAWPSGSPEARAFNLKSDFGAVGDGVTDDFSAFTNALYACSTNGGTLFAPRGTYRISGQVSIPRGTIEPYSHSHTIRIVGEGGGSASYNNRIPQCATTLDLQSGNGVAKILAFTNCRLDLENLALADTVDGTTPFILLTGTTLHARNVNFIGKTNSDVSISHVRQDAIIAGGTSTSFTGTNASDCFQGYGTTIESCSFDWINACLRARVYGNGIQFVNNFVESNCGGRAPVVIVGDTNDRYGATSGLYIAGNLYEMFQYQYGASLSNAWNNTFVGNQHWDTTATTNFVKVYSVNNSANNLFLDTMLDEQEANLADGNSWITQTFINGHSIRVAGVGDIYEKFQSIPFGGGGSSATNATLGFVALSQSTNRTIPTAGSPFYFDTQDAIGGNAVAWDGSTATVTNLTAGYLTAEVHVLVNSLASSGVVQMDFRVNGVTKRSTYINQSGSTMNNMPAQMAVTWPVNVNDVASFTFDGSSFVEFGGGFSYASFTLRP